MRYCKIRVTANADLSDFINCHCVHVEDHIVLGWTRQSKGPDEDNVGHAGQENQIGHL